MKINNSYLFDITLFAIQLFRVSFLVKFEPQSGQTKNYKIGICCFSAKHAALQSKSKDWLDQIVNFHYQSLDERPLDSYPDKT
jgi:hypothetical protein